MDPPFLWVISATSERRPLVYAALDLNVERPHFFGGIQTELAQLLRDELL
jgi:hypothetical protein